MVMALNRKEGQVKLFLDTANLEEIRQAGKWVL